MRHQGRPAWSGAGLPRPRHPTLSDLAVSTHRRTRGARLYLARTERPHRVPAPVTTLTKRLLTVVALLALIGMLGYAALAGLASVYRERRETPVMLFCGAAAGLAFALYLTYIEARVLGVYCILCLSSLALIATTTVLTAIIWRRSSSA